MSPPLTPTPHPHPPANAAPGSGAVPLPRSTAYPPIRPPPHPPTPPPPPLFCPERGAPGAPTHRFSSTRDQGGATILSSSHRGSRSKAKGCAVWVGGGVGVGGLQTKIKVTRSWHMRFGLGRRQRTAGGRGAGRPTQLRWGDGSSQHSHRCCAGQERPPQHFAAAKWVHCRTTKPKTSCKYNFHQHYMLIKNVQRCAKGFSSPPRSSARPRTRHPPPAGRRGS